MYQQIYAFSTKVLVFLLIQVVYQVNDEEDIDPFLDDAIDTVVETGHASTSFIQRKFEISFARAGRIIDQLEERGVISGYQGSKPREVLWTLEKLAEIKTNNSKK